MNIIYIMHIISLNNVSVSICCMGSFVMVHDTKVGEVTEGATAEGLRVGLP